MPGIITLTPLKSTGDWTPSFQSGLQYWFKADAITGLNDGDPVSTWNDQSGNGRNATQSGSNRPVYKTNQLNSLPGVQFTVGSAQYMSYGTDSLAAKGTASIVVFVAYCNFSATGQFRTIVSMKDGAAAGNNLVIFMSGSTPAVNFQDFNFGMSANGGQTGWRNGASTAFTSPAAAGIVYYDGTNNNNASNWTAYKNNTSLTTSAPGGNFNPGANSNNYLGHFPNAGANLSWDGYIFEIFAYSGITLTTTLRTNIKTYIQNKWGITQA